MPEERGEDLSDSAGSEDNDMSARTGRFSATPNTHRDRHMLEEGVILMDSERLHSPVHYLTPGLNKEDADAQTRYTQVTTV